MVDKVPPARREDGGIHRGVAYCVREQDFGVGTRDNAPSQQSNNLSMWII